MAEKDNLLQEIKDLKNKIIGKDKKIVDLAESVAKTQDPPRRVKLGIKYSNKYTKRQMEAFEKNGIDTTHLEADTIITPSK